MWGGCNQKCFCLLNHFVHSFEIVCERHMNEIRGSCKVIKNLQKIEQCLREERKIVKLDLLTPDKQSLLVLLVPIKVTDRHRLILERRDR